MCIETKNNIDSLGLYLPLPGPGFLKTNKSAMQYKNAQIQKLNSFRSYRLYPKSCQNVDFLKYPPSLIR